MTTIKSMYGKELEIRPSNAFFGTWVTLACEDGRDCNPAGHHEARLYQVADLLAALDAVPVADANQSIEHELAQRDEAARLSHEYRNRAEKAEAGQRDLLEGNVRLSRDLARVSAELNRTRETYESELAEAERCERAALEKATAIAAERDRLLATIERIDAVRRDFYEVRGDWADPAGAAALKAQMERAILGDPPFELPTVAGAIGIATFNCVGTEYTKPIRLCRNGTWCSVDEKQYFQPEDIIDFKPAKIVEADQ